MGIRKTCVLAPASNALHSIHRAAHLNAERLLEEAVAVYFAFPQADQDALQDALQDAPESSLRAMLRCDRLLMPEDCMAQIVLRWAAHHHKTNFAARAADVLKFVHGDFASGLLRLQMLSDETLLTLRKMFHDAYGGWVSVAICDAFLAKNKLLPNSMGAQLAPPRQRFSKL